MITLAEAAPALLALRRRMCATEIHSDDLPTAVARLLYYPPDDTLVVSHVDQLAECNRVERPRMVR